MSIATAKQLPDRRTYSPQGFEQNAVLTAATGLTVPAGAEYAVVQAEAQAVRWRDDGVAPTAAVGMSIAAGASVEFNGDLNALSFIEAAVGGILNVSYYG